jgi:hypothetical protein
LLRRRVIYDFIKRHERTFVYRWPELLAKSLSLSERLRANCGMLTRNDVNVSIFA